VIDEQDKREDAEGAAEATPETDAEATPETDAEATPETVDPDAPVAEDAPEAEADEAPEAEASSGDAAEEDDEDAPEAADASGDAAEAEDAPKPRRRRRARKEPEAEAKPARPRTRDGEPAVAVRALAKYVRTSPRKARLVADHVRGKSVDEARAILAFSPRSAARDWSKVLESAVANAEHNHELVGDELRIKTITADEGPTLKRYRPRAMGRATRIRKRTSHLTITLTPKE
jgi:ribosomal protein L22